jgi:GxxExxY protein
MAGASMICTTFGVDQELTGQIIGAFYYVYHTHGFGFLESVYRKALAVELRYRGIRAVEEVPYRILHRGVLVGTYRADLIAGERVIVESKSGALLDPTASPQLLNYLRASRLRVGLVLHFGPKPSVKRLISTRHRLEDCSSDSISTAEEERSRTDD